MTIPWTKVAGTIYQMGKVLLTGKELAVQANALLQERKRTLDSQELVSGRVQQLEDALAKQMELNRQYHMQMELLRSALDDIHKSLRLTLLMAAAALLLSLTAILFAIFK